MKAMKCLSLLILVAGLVMMSTGCAFVEHELSTTIGLKVVSASSGTTAGVSHVEPAATEQGPTALVTDEGGRAPAPKLTGAVMLGEVTGVTTESADAPGPLPETPDVSQATAGSLPESAAGAPCMVT